MLDAIISAKSRKHKYTSPVTQDIIEIANEIAVEQGFKKLRGNITTSYGIRNHFSQLSNKVESIPRTPTKKKGGKTAGLTAEEMEMSFEKLFFKND